MLDGSQNRLQSCYPRVKNTLVSCISPIHLIYYYTQSLNAFERIDLIVLKDETKMSTLNFWGVAHSEIGSAISKKWEISLYSQKKESRNTNFKSIKYGLISEDKGSDTFLQGNLVC